MKSRYLQYDKKESSKVIGTLGSRSCERSVVRCDIGAGRASGRAAGMVGIGGGTGRAVAAAHVHSCLLSGRQNASTKSFSSSTSSASSTAKARPALAQKSEGSGKSYQKDFEFCHFLNVFSSICCS